MFVIEHLILAVRRPRLFQVESHQVQSSVFIGDDFADSDFAPFDFKVEYPLVVRHKFVLEPDLDRVVRFEVAGLNSILVVREASDLRGQFRRHWHFRKLREHAQVAGQRRPVLVQRGQSLSEKA